MNLHKSMQLYEEAVNLEVFLLEKEFDVYQFLTRLQSVVTLARRGATEGEKEASKTAGTTVI